MKYMMTWKEVMERLCKVMGLMAMAMVLIG